MILPLPFGSKFNGTADVIAVEPILYAKAPDRVFHRFIPGILQEEDQQAVLLAADAVGFEIITLGTSLFPKLSITTVTPD